MRTRTRRAGEPPRIGLFGLLGSGNLGNDGSADAVLGHLRQRCPEARLELMCGGRDVDRARFGLPVTRMHWLASEYRTASGAAAIARKALGKIVDAFRTLRWVSGLDVVIVPGMGVLEATLPLQPWGFPYALFLLCAAGRLIGTRVALVCVGADPIKEPAIRWLVTGSARLAGYRSYRDRHSRDAMRAMGVRTADEVYLDLAFALPAPPAARLTGAVGVGVMSYRGDNRDRAGADAVHAAYLLAVTTLVRRLTDEGREVRLLSSDRSDDVVAAAIMADALARHPSARVVSEPAADLDGLMRQMADLNLVVATRYHTVLCALKLSKPTLCLGYADKHVALMRSMGVGEFCLPARRADGDQLIRRFAALEERAPEVRASLAGHNDRVRARTAAQFAALSEFVFGAAARDVHTTPEGVA